MRTEKVLLCEGGGNNERLCQVDEIVVPDIRFQGLFVSAAEQEVINYAYGSALWVQTLILVRQKHASHQEKFSIDIPDLWFIATGQKPALRKELRDEIMLFNMTYQALVRHFLPKAQQVPYSYDGKTRHGVRYKGSAWISNERPE